MRKISMHKRVGSVLLCLSLLCGMVLTGAVLPAAAEEVSEWDYEHTMSATYEYWTLENHFAHYEFAKPSATASAVASRSAENPNMRDWNYTAANREYWSTGYYGTHNNGLLKATQTNGEWDVLTYKVEDMQDFQLQFTIPDAYARQGIMFGADCGVIPATGDGDYDNDTGVILTYENMQFYAGGAVKEDTSNHGDLPNMKVANLTITERTFSMGLSTAVSAATLHTYNVKVENGVLTMWAEGEEALAKSVELSENYKGGYVSFFSGSNQCGLWSFKIKKLSDAEKPEWDYAHTMTAKAQTWKLDAHFRAYEFTRYASNTSATYIGGPYLPSEKIAYNDTVSKPRWLTEHWGSYNTGWLKPMRSADMQVLTYTTKQFKDFEMEVTIPASYEAQGFIFGHKLGEIGVTQDNDNTNDTGVIMRMESAKSWRFAGAVDAADSISEFKGTAVKDANVSANNANAVTGNNEVNTFRIRVVDKVVTVWDVDEPELAKTFNLSDNYEGGYISYFANGCSQNGLASFKVKELDENDFWDYEHTMGQTYAYWALENDFDAYNFQPVKTATSAAATRGPVNPNTKDTDYTASTRDYWATGYYGSHNNGLLKYTSYGSDWGVLTYKVDTMKDFELEFTIPDSYARQGIIFGGKAGVMPVTADGNAANDTGVVLAYENMQFFAAGALKADTANHDDFPNMNVANLTITEREFSMGLSTAVSESTLHTYHVRVENGVLTMWADGEEALAKSVELSEKYKGGYVSFFSASNQCGLWSLKIEKLSDADAHECEFTIGNYDANGHWNECTCGEKDEVKAHVYANDCDATCDCGYTRSIEHNYATTEHDADGHWTVCACGATTEKVAHDFANGDCACGAEKPQAPNTAVADEETKIITVKVDEGYELRAGTLIVTDANGDVFVPTRVGFQNGGDASQYTIPDGAVAPYTVEAEFYQPTLEDLNIGLVGTSYNESTTGLRFIHRANVTEDENGLYMNIGGVKTEIKEYGLLLASGSLVKDPANKLTVKVADESMHVHRYAWSKAADSETRCFDKCEDYVDIAVHVKNIITDKYNGGNTQIHTRLYVVLTDGTIVYDNVESATYNETAGLA